MRCNFMLRRSRFAGRQHCKGAASIVLVLLRSIGRRRNTITAREGEDGQRKVWQKESACRAPRIRRAALDKHADALSSVEGRQEGQALQGKGRGLSFSSIIPLLNRHTTTTACFSILDFSCLSPLAATPTPRRDTLTLPGWPAASLRLPHAFLSPVTGGGG